MKMPEVKIHILGMSEEEKAIIRIIIKSDGTLRASKPKLGKMARVDDPASPYGYRYAWATDSERLKAKAAYVWRMVAFAISPNPVHHCMPTTTSFDLDGTYKERRALEKELDAFANRIIKCVPVREQHGTMRWAQAYGMTGTPQYNEEGAIVYR